MLSNEGVLKLKIGYSLGMKHQAQMFAILLCLVSCGEAPEVPVPVPIAESALKYSDADADGGSLLEPVCENRS